MKCLFTDCLLVGSAVPSWVSCWGSWWPSGQSSQGCSQADASLASMRGLRGRGGGGGGRGVWVREVWYKESTNTTNTCIPIVLHCTSLTYFVCRHHFSLHIEAASNCNWRSGFNFGDFVLLIMFVVLKVVAVQPLYVQRVGTQNTGSNN